MADKLSLKNRKVLLPKENNLMKLYVYIPKEHVQKVRDAIFKAGAGRIGNYSECSFNLPGTGTFKAEEGTDPFVGEVGKMHEEEEVKSEIIFPGYLRNKIVAAMTEAHPYEEVAYDIIPLGKLFCRSGSGLIGELSEEMDEKDLLHLVKKEFRLDAIRHTPLLGRKVKNVALCGGAGSFLLIPLKLQVQISILQEM
jgi:hypothetical protein